MFFFALLKSTIRDVFISIFINYQQQVKTKVMWLMKAINFLFSLVSANNIAAKRTKLSTTINLTLNQIK